MRTVTAEFGNYCNLSTALLEIPDRIPSEMSLTNCRAFIFLKIFQVLVISLIQTIVIQLSQFSYVPSSDSCCCSPWSRSHAFGGKHQHPRCHSVSVFPNRRIKGGIRNFVGQPWPAWTTIFVSRLLWAVVKKTFQTFG